MTSIVQSSIQKFYHNSNLNLVILHGLMGSKNNFKTVSQSPLWTSQLNSTHLLDLRNHGESPHTQSMTLGEMAGDLSDYIKGINDVVLLGHSLGGRVIFKYLQQYEKEVQEKVKGVIIVDILPKAVQSTYVHELLKKLIQINLNQITYNQLMEKVFEASQNKSIAQLLMTNLQSQQPIMRKDIQYDFKWRVNLQGILNDFQTNILTDITANWKGPHCVICGDRSQYVNNQTVNQMKMVFPNFKEAHFIQDCGHWVHSEKPQEFIQIVSSFIQTLR
ncbi:unnamed protein product (macronuclear) [Paramecium tetraurelia]|uniref:Chromosome undetermined scaffold_1, whole genome shotgun sequence n=1 Tax=Paramecium tetraurelia TaxID=5888 RepID=Q6BFM1_PARTE|nr:Epoxide hydrolase [Paramecium tetraurelia strain d4-2]XP_001423105.1 uncharacterized protein GSPATT00000142001 [Paramecium tetraurelia]CAH03549.1 Epoxide hydrolase, putative [Paramecium tetraurelia]CAK55707.1 unnamed protein product [Paramecium tetraurelia]|eukprot:XP_001423105.1 hypothetical protein (macronuclear) [Paramecium tetraurelia strain d4-2]